MKFGITQQELANRLNSAKSSIAMYENETRKPSLEVLLKLSEIFNCSIDYLLCKSNVRNSENSPFISIPIIKKLKLDNLLNQDNIIDTYNLELFSGLDKDTSKYFAVEPPDNSLSPIGKGDLAIVYINNQYTSDTLYLIYLKNENRYTIKELIETKSGYELFSPNGEHLSSSKDNLVILGQIIKFEGFYKK